MEAAAYLPTNSLLMPIFMDLHVVPGVNAKDVADAHSMDVLMEKEHSCKCLTYWIDELRGYVFCLIDAPDKESVVELHSRAHGLVPNKIIEVDASLVQAFLGRITDPENAYVTESGLVILDDTSYRVIMHLRLPDSAMLQQVMGREVAGHLLRELTADIKQQVVKSNGRVVSHSADEVIASFVEGRQALAAAQVLLSQAEAKAPRLLRIALHAGEPVAQSDKLFGDAVELLRRLNFFAGTAGIVVTSAIRELISADRWSEAGNQVQWHDARHEQFISELLQVLDQQATRESFDMSACSKALGLSESALYRRLAQLFGQAPNQLLRSYRLQRSLAPLRSAETSVAQVGFSVGFASASYFSKCFREQYGMSPQAYQECWKQT